MGIDKNTSKEREENALAASLMTMSQMLVPDVARELAEVWTLHSLFRGLRREAGRW
jgi:hypothetical protein